MEFPLVTVGVALYNHQDYIVECLKSIVTQNYSNIELIVVDDGSKDNSYNVAKSYLEEQSFLDNYSIVTRPNKGMCETLNEIAHKAKGKYISFIGSDDFWMQDKISEQVEFLENNEDCTLVHSNSLKVDAQGKVLKPIDYSDKINSGSVYEALINRTGGINTPSHLYRTSIYEEVGYYDPNFRFEDTDFWLRLSRNHKVGFINKAHTYYRWHGDNLSDNKNALSFYYDELIRIYNKNIPEPDLKRIAIKKIYRKCAQKSLKAGRIVDTIKYLIKYFSR
ncbi:glycosyltransferase [Aliikangiella sp. G2MR2-5]|uniref:glycosyltransferase n=1 Tax=Aliikangiella sp. G2MR2-5 TaxID=2788943 RepID=UPI0018A8C31E|nr:glycosyltransferase [Aliikangiella sp. G2MR2-5]